MVQIHAGQPFSAGNLLPFPFSIPLRFQLSRLPAKPESHHAMQSTEPVFNPSPHDPLSPAPMSLPARLMNIFAAPGEVYDSLRSSSPSTGNWLAPALLAVLVGWIATTIIFSLDSVKQQLSEISQQAIEKQIAKTKPSKQQADQMRDAAERFGAIGQKVGGYFGPVVLAFTSPFIWGGILWLIGAKKFGGGFSYMKAVEVVGLSNMIGVLEGIIKTLLIVVFGSLWAGPHAGMLVIKTFDPQNPLHGVLAAFSVMTIWVLAVRALGLAKISGVSFGRAAAWVFSIWIVYTALFAGIGFLVQRLMQGAGPA